jgi:hypothetical protein
LPNAALQNDFEAANGLAIEAAGKLGIEFIKVTPIWAAIEFIKNHADLGESRF